MVENLAADPAKFSPEVRVSTPTSERLTTASGQWVREEMKESESSSPKLTLLMPSRVEEIEDDIVRIKTASGETEQIDNHAVFMMIGREAPLEFFRRSNIRISGESTPLGWLSLGLFMIFCLFVYTWKSGGPTETWLNPWPENMPSIISSMGQWFSSQVSDRSTLIGTLAVSLKSRSFYYTALYSLCIVIFGIARINRRKTPYVKLQTSVLMAVQVIPLFLLPEIILPWLGYNGVFSAGFGKYLADSLFESYISSSDYADGLWPEWGHPRAYWRAYGFILAWPLMIYNVFTDSPMSWWLAISIAQTFVIIPLLIFFWGKGAYCGWICSCGALAETLGDTQRKKMPHGQNWNYLNMAGQLILAVALFMLALRIFGWIYPESWADQVFPRLLEGRNRDGLSKYLSYKWAVDILLGGILGVGLYFKYSGRFWCRFFCPLAALMHIYARFSRFRIFADKSKCISCNVCTSVCHQGIDIMNFANKGLPMSDPECVRCSACVQSCPTGVLSFGRFDSAGKEKYDKLGASLVQLTEKNKSKGK
jgi:ferredoxin